MTIGGLDDVEMVLEFSCGDSFWRLGVGSVEACSSFISYSSSKLSLATPKDWTPQTSLDWIQEKASWYLHTELVLLYSIGADKICEDRDLPQLIVLDGFYQ